MRDEYLCRQQIEQTRAFRS